MVQLLLETEKVDVNSRDYEGQSPFSLAAGSGQEAAEKLLLEIGQVEVESKNHEGRTPLFWAVNVSRLLGMNDHRDGTFGLEQI